MSSSSSSSSNGSEPSSSSDRTRGVTLRKASVSRYTTSKVDGFRFRVEAVDPVDMPADIFLYLRRPLDPATGADADEFSNVCSPADLEEYPVGSPTGTPPFFRAAEVDLVFRSQSQAEEAWESIRAEVAVLVDTLNLMDGLENAEEIRIGG